MVQGFHAWKKMGRTVKKGSKGIGIIAPMVYRPKEDGDGGESNNGKAIRGFKVVHVFDVSMTEGEDLPEFAKVTGDPGENIEAVERLIRSEGIELVYESIPGGADGLSQKGTIVIVLDLEPAKRLITLVQKLAHERLHADAERRKDTTKTIRETEAEAVAHVVGRGLGLESVEHCADYIQLYNGDIEVLANSMDYIQKTAARILEDIQTQAAALEAEKEDVAA
jgi:hypothetical protein